MINCGWVTDCHLDFIDNDKSIIQFGNNIISSNPDVLLFTGDISNSKRLIYHLSALETITRRPIYFILGNHDYYGSSISEVRKLVTDTSAVSQHLKYLSSIPYVSLTRKTALLGHDCWYDAQHGNPLASNVTMNDWVQIKDFVLATKNNARDTVNVINCARKLAHEGITHLYNGIKNAVRYHENIVILTHVPPFKEAHVYNGKQGDEFYSPWYTSKLTGDLLLQAANTYPKNNFLVLSGHTHNRWSGKIKNNLTVKVGNSEYGSPTIEELISVA